MRLIVSGSRHFGPFLKEYRGVTTLACLAAAITNAGFDPSEIVHGACKGMDAVAQEYADLRELPVRTFPADWNTHGKAAGPVRNGQMAEYAAPDGALVAFPQGDPFANRGGTQSMIREASALGLPCFVVTDPYLEMRYGKHHVWINRA